MPLERGASKSDAPSRTPHLFAGKPAVHFVDNQGVLWNLVDGASREPGCDAIAHTVAATQLACRVNVWYEYVASDDNIADLPSRNDFSYVSRLARSARRGVRWFNLELPALGWVQ